MLGRIALKSFVNIIPARGYTSSKSGKLASAKNPAENPPTEKELPLNELPPNNPPNVKSTCENPVDEKYNSSKNIFFTFNIYPFNFLILKITPYLRKGNTMKKTLYHYKAIVQNVYDGDTCTVDIDLGLHTWIKGEKLRLNRINAPEVTGKERLKGLKSKEYLKSLILNKEVFIETIKDKKEKYGRYLAEVWLEQTPDNFLNINDLMVKNGFAVYKKY